MQIFFEELQEILKQNSSSDFYETFSSKQKFWNSVALFKGPVYFVAILWNCRATSKCLGRPKKIMVDTKKNKPRWPKAEKKELALAERKESKFKRLISRGCIYYSSRKQLLHYIQQQKLFAKRRVLEQIYETTRHFVALPEVKHRSSRSFLSVCNWWYCQNRPAYKLQSLVVNKSFCKGKLDTSTKKSTNSNSQWTVKTISLLCERGTLLRS